MTTEVDAYSLIFRDAQASGGIYNSEGMQRWQFETKPKRSLGHRLIFLESLIFWSSTPKHTRSYGSVEPAEFLRRS
jgi:hypothetical protein